MRVSGKSTGLKELLELGKGNYLVFRISRAWWIPLRPLERWAHLQSWPQTRKSISWTLCRRPQSCSRCPGQTRSSSGDSSWAHQALESGRECLCLNNQLTKCSSRERVWGLCLENKILWTNVNYINRKKERSWETKKEIQTMFFNIYSGFLLHFY